MSGTMTDQDLLNRGFKEYPPTYPIDYDGIETKFQKRYDDDDGKGGTNLIKILLYAGWDVDEVEEYVRKLFETGLFEYYEKWEDC